MKEGITIEKGRRETKQNHTHTYTHKHLESFKHIIMQVQHLEKEKLL